MEKELLGKAALVTGASRGVGKGIALALGEAGATVYVTGRTTSTANATVPLPGTIAETADRVSQSGGAGIAVGADSANDTDIEQVFQRIHQEQGRLDILVNNAWGGYQAKQRGRKSESKTKFWKSPPSFWDSMMNVAVRSHYVASVHAARVMTSRKSGVIIHVSGLLGDGPAENVAYGVAKTAVNRMAADMAHELRAEGVAVIALCPVIVATEMIMAKRKKQALEPWMETPSFVGKAVVHLASDPDIMSRTGRVQVTRALAREYGFTDVGGHVPT